MPVPKTRDRAPPRADRRLEEEVRINYGSPLPNQLLPLVRRPPALPHSSLDLEVGNWDPSHFQYP